MLTSLICACSVPGLFFTRSSRSVINSSSLRSNNRLWVLQNDRYTSARLSAEKIQKQGQVPRFIESSGFVEDFEGTWNLCPVSRVYFAGRPTRSFILHLQYLLHPLGWLFNDQYSTLLSSSFFSGRRWIFLIESRIARERTPSYCAGRMGMSNTTVPIQAKKDSLLLLICYVPNCQ